MNFQLPFPLTGCRLLFLGSHPCETESDWLSSSLGTGPVERLPSGHTIKPKPVSCPWKGGLTSHHVEADCLRLPSQKGRGTGPEVHLLVLFSE